MDSIKMERLIFKSKSRNYYLVADAYNGKYIRQCTTDFLKSCSGQIKDTIHVNSTSIGIYGNATLLSYIGHDGLMDFRLNDVYNSADGRKRDVIILACISKKYFAPHLLPTKANPLVWTTGLMCPEAYTLHDAVESYLNNEPGEQIRNSAAIAYAKYQHCSIKAARNLLVAAW